MNYAISMDIRELLSKIDVAAFMRRLNAVPPALSNAKAAGRFPAAWYAVVKHECDLVGIECPLELFTFRGMDKPRNKKGDENDF